MALLVQELLDDTATRLKRHSETPQLDAQVLLAHILEQPRTWLLAHPTTSLETDPAAAFETLVARLEHGEPLPYLLGHWEFFGVDFEITPDVLIPRPETELLVERGIAWLQASLDRRAVADIGTGSGCIAVSLAIKLANVHVMATDISRAALNVARRNASKLNVADRIDFVECDILPDHNPAIANGRNFDLICANLPYIPTKKLSTLAVHEHEPLLALDGGEDGLDPFRKLFRVAPDWMSAGGRILLEIESSHSAAVLSLAYDAFAQAELHLHQDLMGHDRLLEIQLPSS